MGASIGTPAIPRVVDRQEDVCDFREVRQRTADALNIDCLHEQESHAGTQENNPGPWVLWENLPLKPSKGTELVLVYGTRSDAKEIVKKMRKWIEWEMSNWENQVTRD